MRPNRLSVLIAVSALCLSPLSTSLDLSPVGAAFAKGGDNGGGNGGGNGGSNGNGNSGGNGKGNSAANGNSTNSKASTGGTTVRKKVKADTIVEDAVAESTKVKPNKMGKMNGALNANINAVLAHIRNGQTTNGPVALLAGLAVADGAVAAATDKAAALEAEAAGYVALESALADAGIGSISDYIAGKVDGTVTPEQIAAIDPLIAAVGGLNAEGTGLAETGPTPEEIQAAIDAAATAGADVATAEQAIGDAWNKDGDLEALLVALREKLAPHQAEISAALDTPTDAPVIEGEVVN